MEEKKILSKDESKNSSDNLSKDRYHKFVEDILSCKIHDYDLYQKINVAGSPKEVKLKISYPDDDANGCKLYQAFICDKSTDETYMSYYTKDKILFMWYITNFIIVLL